MLAIACYPLSQALEPEIHASNEFTFLKSTPDSCFVLLGTHQWCPVLRDTLYALCGKTVLERLQFRYFSVITKPIWQSSVTRMAFPLSRFGWVCKAYPCPANVIFPQLELIQTLSREFERGPVSVSYTVLLTGVAQATGHTVVNCGVERPFLV